MPKTATPRKPETVSRKLAETRAKSKNRSLSSLLGIGDNEKRLAVDIGSGLNDVIGRGTIAGLLGLPGDLAGAGENTLRSLLGLPQVTPYGGSEHIGQKLEDAGLVSNVRRPKTELLASLISPAQAATAGYKAPQMARAGVKALDNLSAPRTMGRQQGAIENLWHGSPHTFDRFDLSKIGTGEGAQAYGHGAYLAEHPEVSKTYMRTQINNAPELEQMALRAGASPEAANTIAQWYHSTKGNGGLDAALSILREPHPVPTMQKYRDGILKEEPALRKAWDNFTAPGNLYQTRLAWPDAREATDPLSPDHFLHWDKPLSEQSEYVQDAFNKAIESRRTALTPPEDPDRWLSQLMALDSAKGYYTGGGSSKALSASFPMEDTDAMRETSRLLAEQGIPGFRYLDGGSRGAGAGSHNYVVFDDKLIDIVSRNGQPVGNIGKMVAPQDEALRVAQANGLPNLLSGGDNAPMTKGGISDIWRRYNETDEIVGDDVIRELDAYALNNDLPPDIADAVRSYKDAYQMDVNEFGLRGDSSLELENVLSLLEKHSGNNLPSGVIAKAVSGVPDISGLSAQEKARLLISTNDPALYDALLSDLRNSP